MIIASLDLSENLDLLIKLATTGLAGTSQGIDADVA